jgi:hypothetical protein
MGPALGEVLGFAERRRKGGEWCERGEYGRWGERCERSSYGKWGFVVLAKLVW